MVLSIVFTIYYDILIEILVKYLPTREYIRMYVRYFQSSNYLHNSFFHLIGIEVYCDNILSSRGHVINTFGNNVVGKLDF